MRRSFSFWNLTAPVVASVALAALWFVGARKELWFDERFVQVIGNLPFRAMFDVLRFENNPPFTYVLSHAWQAAFGSSEIALRTMTLLPTLGFLWTLYFSALRLAKSRTVASATVLLASVSGIVVTQSDEVRMYPWLMLWSSLALFLTWLWSEHPRQGTMLALVLVHVFGLYTHYTYFFVFGFSCAWMLARHRGQWKHIMLYNVVPVLAFLPWFFLSLLPKLQDLSTNVGIQRIAAARWEIVLAPIQFIVPTWFLEQLHWRIVHWLADAAIAVGILSFGFLCFRAGTTRTAARFVATFLLVVGLALTTTGIVVPKYASSLISPLLIAVAWGLVRIPLSRNIVAFILITLFGISTLTSIAQARLPYVTYKAATAVVVAHEQQDDRMLVYPFNDEIAVRPYYAGNLVVHGFFPLSGPEAVSLRDIVQYNFRVTLDSGNIQRLKDYVGTSKRVWFLYDVPPSSGYWRGDLIANWFTEHGFQATMYRDLFKNIPPLLVRYDRQ
jgi:uncharacterized membrane protein